MEEQEYDDNSDEDSSQNADNNIPSTSMTSSSDINDDTARNDKWFVDECRIRLLCQWISCKSTAYLTPQQLTKHVSQHIEFCQNLYKSQGDDGTRPILFHCPWYQSRCKTVLSDIHQLAGHCYNHVCQDKLRAVGLYIQNQEQLPDCQTIPVDEVEWTSKWPEFLCLWEGCDVRTYVTYKFYEHVNCHLHIDSKLTCMWQGCGKRVKIKSKLREHMRSHTQEKSVICSVCQKSFSCNRGFVDHIERRQRFTADNFECEVCNKVFSRERVYRLHLYTHGGKEPSRYVCSVCGQQLTSSSNLKSHMKYKHSTEGQVYACNLCSYKAKTIYSYRRHEETHCTPNLRPQKCNNKSCQFASNNKEEMQNHKQYVHGVKETLVQYGCHMCDAKYNRLHDMKKHYAKKHNYDVKVTSKIKRFMDYSAGVYKLQANMFKQGDGS